MEEVPSYELRAVREWRMALQNTLRARGIWESVKDGYIPPKRVRSVAQKEAKRKNDPVPQQIGRITPRREQQNFQSMDAGAV